MKYIILLTSCYVILYKN